MKVLNNNSKFSRDSELKIVVIDHDWQSDQRCKHVITWQHSPTFGSQSIERFKVDLDIDLVLKWKPNQVRFDLFFFFFLNEIYLYSSCPSVLFCIVSSRVGSLVFFQANIFGAKIHESESLSKLVWPLTDSLLTVKRVFFGVLYFSEFSEFSKKIRKIQFPKIFRKFSENFPKNIPYAVCT